MIGCRVMRFGFVLLVLSVGMREASAAFVTTGVYDEQVVQTNAVDRSATSDANPNEISLATFKTLVANAFAANHGGVIDFQNHSSLPFPGSTFPVGGTFAATFGASQNRSISITNNSNSAMTWTTAGSNRTSISGDRVLGKGSGDDAFDFLINVADQVTHVGVTLLSRGDGDPNNMSVTAYFSGGGTRNITTSIAAVNATDDTFFGFAAPAGQYITRLRLDSTNNRFTNLDDFGFVVVPEPSSMLLLLSAAIATLVLFRRRGR